MFTYELQQARQSELYHQAAEWRLARDAKAARAGERRARRSRTRAAVRTDPEGAPSSSRSAGRLHRALHPHSAA